MEEYRQAANPYASILWRYAGVESHWSSAAKDTGGAMMWGTASANHSLMRERVGIGVWQEPLQLPALGWEIFGDLRVELEEDRLLGCIMPAKSIV